MTNPDFCCGCGIDCNSFYTFPEGDCKRACSDCIVIFERDRRERERPVFVRWFWASNWGELDRIPLTSLRSRIESVSSFYREEFRQSAQWEVIDGDKVTIYDCQFNEVDAKSFA